MLPHDYRVSDVKSPFSDAECCGDIISLQLGVISYEIK